MMKRGDIVNLGPHRLMCGDCTEAEDVSRLFGEDKASTVIFSPPYKDRRKYDGGPCQEGRQLFVGALESMPYAADVQVFAVVGNLHTKGQQDTFYEEWLSAAQAAGWKRFSTYIWDKQHGLPGNWSGRLAPCFEWIFHLNKLSRQPLKHVRCIWGGGRHTRRNKFSKGDTVRNRIGVTQITADFKIDDSIIRINPAGRVPDLGHPAVFPWQLAERLLKSYAAPHGVVYDPMTGSGSTIIAAQCLNLRGLGCEISENYCDITVERYRKHIEKFDEPSKPKRKVVTA